MASSGATGAIIIAILVGIFTLSWGAVHGILELMQAGDVFEWEPTWIGSLGITLALSYVGSSLRGSSD